MTVCANGLDQPPMAFEGLGIVMEGEEISDWYTGYHSPAAEGKENMLPGIVHVQLEELGG